jgi:two-component system NtrC family sensor kinase
MQFIRAERILRFTAAAALLLPAGYFAVYAWSSYNNQVAVSRAQLELTAAVAREHAVKVFETQELLVERVNLLLSGLPDEVIRAREPDLNRELKNLTERFDQVQDVGVMNRDGRPLVSANLYPTPFEISYADRPHFKALAEGATGESGTYISPMFRGRVQTARSFFFAKERSRTDDGAFNGIVSVGMDPSYFTQVYGTMASGSVSAIGLFRSDGSLLARFPDPTGLPDGWATPRLADAITRQPGQSVFEMVSEIDGTPRLVAYQRVGNYPVYVVAGMDYDAVRAEWLRTFATHMIFGLPMTLAFFGLTLFAIRQVRAANSTYRNLRDEVARREATEQQLRQAQKMEAVGRLTGGVAHDFNNLLTIVLGNLDRARKYLAVPAQLQTSLDRATEGATRAAKLTQRLLAFSRQQPLQPHSLDVNRLVGAMSDLMQRTLGEDVRIETTLAASLWRSKADPNELENAILNLAVNGRDAMQDGGTLRIATANAQVDAARAAALGGKAGEYVAIAVSDNGAGMSPEVIARAFEPFFTTKPADRGTGLGLSQVYGFATQTGGFVTIDSTPGTGTTVTIYLPRDPDAGPDEAESPVRRAQQRPLRAGGAVLVLEDDALVRRLAAEMLEDAGFEVIAAGTAARAISSLEAHGDIALLLTDIVLGGGATGVEVARRALNLRPDLRVLFMTGYASESHLAGRPPGAVGDVIVKPFTAEDLVARVRQVLSR